MQTPEKLLGGVEVSASGITRSTFGLYVTDRRLAFIHANAGNKATFAAGLIAGIPGALIAGALSKPKTEDIDSMLQKDKANFELDYSHVESIELSEGMFGCRLKVASRYVKQEFKLDTGNPFDKLCTWLSSIPELKGKLKINAHNRRS